MNIGYLYEFNSYPPQNGGSVHVYNLVRGLTALGHKIHAFNYEKSPACVTYPVNEEGRKQFLDNIDLLYVRIDGSLLSRSRLKLRCMEQAPPKPIVWEINAPAEEMLSKFNFNTVFNKGLPLGKLKRKLAGLRAHSRLWREERCRRRYAHLVDAAICVSQPLEKYAAEGLGISKCSVITNGSDPDTFSPERRNTNLFLEYRDYFKVIYAGDSRWPWQGFDLVVELAKMAKRRGDKILYVALTNSPSTDLTSTDNLLVLSKVSYLDVPAYIASADACLCLYHDFSWSEYGFHLSPLKLFDYMACGKPIIASRLGQITSVLEDGKDGLLTTNDVEDIYSKILSCMKCKDRAAQLGISARDKIRRFYNWQKVADSTSKIFASLVDNKKAPFLKPDSLH